MHILHVDAFPIFATNPIFFQVQRLPKQVTIITLKKGCSDLKELNKKNANLIDSAEF
jgi:hypothetical protein